MKTKLLGVAVAVAFPGAGFPADARTYTYSTIDFPSASYTQAYGINAKGQIVGSYGTFPNAHGFLYSGGSYATLNDPAANQGTYAYGINAKGQIVGTYEHSYATHGFLYSGGSYQTLDDPMGIGNTSAFGINAKGQIVGFYQDSNGLYHGFLYSGGSYVTLDDPLATQGTHAYAAIPRRFCIGKVHINDGTARRINYSIAEDTGIIGATWGVEWCVVGLDRNWAYASPTTPPGQTAPACREAGP
jgi:probable HAF family extracellular repeat protein